MWIIWRVSFRKRLANRKTKKRIKRIGKRKKFKIKSKGDRKWIVKKWNRNKSKPSRRKITNHKLIKYWIK